MSLDLMTPMIGSLQRSGRRDIPRIDRTERRRRDAQDRRAARLAELYCIRALIQEATTIVEAGWLQHDWFAVTDKRGHQSRVGPYNLHLVENRTVSAACLVGSIVHAGGGPRAAHSQLVQRTLDLTWHTLYENAHDPVRWCPAPPVRIAHLRDLTRWNDHPQRTAADVTGLLHSATRTAEAQTDLVRVH